MEPGSRGRFIVDSMTLSGKQLKAAEFTPAKENDESAWIARAQAGDERAWFHLVTGYQEVAFRLAYLILGSAADAEDVAQEAFVRAYLALDRFDGARPFRPWLLQIVRNQARNHRRSLSRYLAYLTRWRAEEPDTAVAHSTHQARTDARLLWQAVQKLPPKGREIVYLRYFLEMSEAETAVILDIPTGTAKSRLSRALSQLRGVIERDFPELRGMGD